MRARVSLKQSRAVTPVSAPKRERLCTMSNVDGLEPVATFCGDCDCGCPQLFVDPAAPNDRRVILTDDFGQRVQMSADQFSSIVADAKAGKLDDITTA